MGLPLVDVAQFRTVALHDIPASPFALDRALIVGLSVRTAHVLDLVGISQSGALRVGNGPVHTRPEFIDQRIARIVDVGVGPGNVFARLRLAVRHCADGNSRRQHNGRENNPACNA